MSYTVNELDYIKSAGLEWAKLNTPSGSEKFSTFVCDALRKAGMTQRDLANEIGYSESFICDVLNGRRNINLKLFIAIVERLT